MTNDDDWLREAAREKKRQAAETRERQEALQMDEDRRKAVFTAQIDELWGELQAEFQRKVDVYNDGAGTQELYVEVHPHQISIRSPAGVFTLHLNRELQSLGEEYKGSNGGNVIGTPVGRGFSFRVSDDDRLAFAGGRPARLADAVLRRLLSW